jgi:hypothetical protein
VATVPARRQRRFSARRRETTTKRARREFSGLGQRYSRPFPDLPLARGRRKPRTVLAADPPRGVSPWGHLPRVLATPR